MQGNNVTILKSEPLVSDFFKISARDASVAHTIILSHRTKHETVLSWSLNQRCVMSDILPKPLFRFWSHRPAKLTDIRIFSKWMLSFTVARDEEAFVILDFKGTIQSNQCVKRRLLTGFFSSSLLVTFILIYIYIIY